jgi:hypothetical protein
MGLLNKDENWWLRLTIVLITMGSLSTLAYYNKEITMTKVKYQSDSTFYYKSLTDSLLKQQDSLMDENFELNHANGLQELMIYNLSHENPKYKDLEKDLEKEANSNKYE